ncbi:hypothetical protein [Paracoccus sanguinis]|uniref:hypothetical protein n=1 Tax=Paracoccus sanguinis TaxID=1545044 RepID=UPI001E5E4824|nr:hypothetical protein [Paracoccus sanguinis]
MVALKIDSLSVANGKSDADWAEMVTAWEARLQGWNAEAQQRLDVDRASRSHAVCVPARRGVANLPVRELLDRVTAITSAAGASDDIEARALLSGAGEPRSHLPARLTCSTEHILLTAKLAYTDILFDGANSSRSIPRSRST